MSKAETENRQNQLVTTQETRALANRITHEHKIYHPYVCCSSSGGDRKSARAPFRGFRRREGKIARMGTCASFGILGSPLALLSSVKLGMPACFVGQESSTMCGGCLGDQLRRADVVFVPLYSFGEAKGSKVFRNFYKAI